MTMPRDPLKWVVTHMPENFTTSCPEDIEEDVYLACVVMAVNLADADYQLNDLHETLAHNFTTFLGDDNSGCEQCEYAWYVAEQAIVDAKQLYPVVKPPLRALQDREGFGVDVTQVFIDNYSVMMTVEAI